MSINGCLNVDILAFIFLMASGVAFIYIFISILLTGGYMAIEPNRLILCIEIAMSLFIFGLGLYCFIEALRKL